MTEHHHHDPGLPASDRSNMRFAVGIGLNVLFVIAEVVFGLLANSTALLSDAAHNLSDVLGLALSWWALLLARKKPTERRTYGYKKATILAALANAMIILVAVGAIVREGVTRLSEPPPVQGYTVLVVAGIGLVLNTASALLFLSGRGSDLNIRGAFVHLASDAAVSAGVVVAGLLIAWTGKSWIDPVTSLVISVVVIGGTWSLLKGSFNLAMDGVPADIRLEEVTLTFKTCPGVVDIHDLHVWAMSSTENALTAHVVVDASWTPRNLTALEGALKQNFNLVHTTIQVEPAGAGPCPQGEEDVV